MHSPTKLLDQQLAEVLRQARASQEPGMKALEELLRQRLQATKDRLLTEAEQSLPLLQRQAQTLDSLLSLLDPKRPTIPLPSNVAAVPVV